jgi:protein-S-isoprenylcysteine O-methyltransferase Ste14
MSTNPAPRVRVVPPVYLLAAVVAMGTLHAFLPGGTLLPRPWNWLGLLPIGGGLLLGGLTARLFWKHKTTIKPGETPSRMISEGPFRVSRNPIYVGMVLVLSGIALLLGSLTPWLVAPVFIALIARNVIPVEEAMLQETFGEEYQQYRTKVRRWI